MAVYILTSMFHNEFPCEFVKELKELIVNRRRFVFIASEFRNFQEKNNTYFKFFYDKFLQAGIAFEECFIVDDRMKKEQAQQVVRDADVIWLSGGNTPVQFEYFQEYGLDTVLKNHNGVILGMSAGAINMSRTAICTCTCEHDEQKIYPALGLVELSVEPHYDSSGASEELLELSDQYCIYALCDEAAIICADKGLQFLGEIYSIEGQVVKQVSFQ